MASGDQPHQRVAAIDGHRPDSTIRSIARPAAMATTIYCVALLLAQAIDASPHLRRKTRKPADHYPQACEPHPPQFRAPASPPCCRNKAQRSYLTEYTARRGMN